MQVLQNAKQDLQQSPALNKHSTKFSQLRPQSVHLVDEQMKKMEITMNAVHGKQAPVTNSVLHSVMGYIESDENIPKSITTPVSSPFHKITTPVKNSSDVNILSSPITTTPSCIPGPVLEDRLKSLESYMTQLFNILTTSMNNKNEPTQIPKKSDKLPEEKKIK